MAHLIVIGVVETNDKPELQLGRCENISNLETAGQIELSADDAKAWKKLISSLSEPEA